MKLFRKKKDSGEDAAGAPGEAAASAEADQVAPGEGPGAPVEADVSTRAETGPDDAPGDEPTISPEGDAAVVEPGEKADGNSQPDDFFDLPPEKVAEWMPRGMVVAVPRKIDLMPVLKVFLLAVTAGVLVAGIYLIWPTSTAHVPDLVGKGLTEAMETARSHGFDPVVTGWSYSEAHSDGVVLKQTPEGASVVKKGSSMSLTVSKGPRPETGSKTTVKPPAPAATTATGPFAGKVVCVDPAGQSRPGIDEWSDPGMTRKNTPEGEIRGATTGNAGYLVNMDIANKLKSLLEKDGITVVMTRETNDVELTNTMRAEIANSVNASILMRIHCANSDDPFVKGTRTLYPAESQWTEPIYQQSKAAALFVQTELLKACGTEDLGTSATHDNAGLNWSSVPAVQAEPGYLSSPRDDTLLAEDNYRWKVAWGLRNGIVKYLTNP
jgi:N-acetylmuramoyl-L-alanine amidase